MTVGMAAAGLFLVLVLLIGVGGGLVLYWLVRSEHDRREVMDRTHAERAARRDTHEDDGP